jgi:mannose-6-phosphate isomerase
MGDLRQAAAAYRAWLRDAALPLWGTAGVDPSSGVFAEALDQDGRPTDAPRRARVQARQVFVFARAADAGFGDGWRGLALTGYRAFRARHLRPDGLLALKTAADGAVLDPAAHLYEQAFALLAMSALHAPRAGRDLSGDGRTLRAAIEAFRHPAGGFRERDDHPFQSNAHMHLLEAAMAWEETGDAGGWAELADEIVTLSLTRFIDAEGGFLREFFDEAWRPAPGDDGRWVEPGHQFEWAWLLERWGRARGHARARQAARTLFAHGVRGLDAGRGVAVNVLWDDLSVRDPVARLWPQTEWLKASVILGEEGQALVAARGLAQYLAVPTPGAWRDRRLADGSFVDEPAPASSFYHLMLAIQTLLDAA